MASCSGLSTRLHILKPVPRPANRDRVPRLVRPLLDLLAQPPHVDVDRPRRDIPLLAPRRFQKLLAAIRMSRMRQKKLQQVELGRGQFQLFVLQENPPPGRAQTERPDGLSSDPASSASRRKCAFTRATRSRGLNGLVM
jgi:hypothetical protein